MYGGAGFGWILYIIIPSVVSALLNVIAERRISRLRSQQRDLISEWGKDVSVKPETIENSENKSLA